MVLAKAGYQGYYCLEWEKKWHPRGMEEPEMAFPGPRRRWQGSFREAGVKPA